MDFEDVIEGRKSTRSFEDKAVEEEKIAKILEIVKLAPSAGNLQSFKVYITKDPEKRKKLSEASHSQPWVEKAPVVMVFCADFECAESRYAERGRKLYATQDATIATAYAQLAAESLGLATVWIGAFQGPEVKEIVGYGDNLEAVALLPVGYAAEKPGRRDRKADGELFSDF